MSEIFNPDMFQDICDFHNKFGLIYDGKPRRLSDELDKFRRMFMDEELDEYFDATTERDMHGQLDALVDLAYVVLGTAYLHGFNFPEAWRRVHAANMSKVRATSSQQSKRSTAYDVVKPEGWKAPDLRDLVEYVDATSY